MFKNTASQKITFLVIDTATNLPKTGDSANLTAYVSIDDGSVTALTDTSATELDATNAPGLYTFDCTQAETNGDKLVFSGKSSTSGVRVVPALIYTLPANFTSLSISTGSAQIGVNVVQSNGFAVMGTGTVTTGATTTSIPTSACSPSGAATAANKFIGRVILFSNTTTTAGLRGVACTILANTNSATPTFTVALEDGSPLPDAPASGDVFVIV